MADKMVRGNRFYSNTEEPATSNNTQQNQQQGEGARMGGADYANAALGVYSLIRGLTAKKPRKLSLTPYKPNIRPASGDPDGLARAKNQIASQTASASRDVTRIAGSDFQSGMQARLGIQANASKVLSDVEFNNSTLYKEDQRRVSDELNKANLINTQLQNEASQINQQQDRETFAATQRASSSGLQSAIQYEANRSADIKNKQVAENQSNQFIDAVDKGNWHEAYNNAIIGGNDPEQAKAIADESLKKSSVSQMKTSFYTGKRGFFGRSRN